MDTLIWLLKVNIALTLLYACYKLFFQQDTFFKVKRIVLLSALFFSLVYPFLTIKELSLFQVTQTTGLEGSPITFDLPEFISPGVEKAPQTIPVMNIMVIIWIIGVILLSSYFIFQMISIVSKILFSKRTQKFGMNIYVLKGLKNPFSFFHYIVIDPDFHDEQELSEILHHEKTHALGGHTCDVIFSELICLVCWMNPFVWLLRKEIRMNLEYLADRSVISVVNSIEHYQLHLLRLSYHKAIAQLSNNFNVSPLKKRIKMMNKKKSSVIGIIKYILFVPLLAGLLVVNNLQLQAQDNQSKVTQETQSQVIVIDPPADKNVFERVEEMPEYPGGVEALMKYISETVRYPIEAMKQGIQGQVVCRFIVNQEGDVTDVNIVRSLDPSCDAEAVRVIEAMPKWIPGKQGGKAVNVYFTLPIRFKLTSDVITEPTAATTQIQETQSKTNGAPDDKLVFMHVEQMPQYPGGQEALMKYLAENIRYPEDAQKQGIQGQVICRFIVNQAGDISDVTLVQSLHPACDEEAIRIIKEMPKWIPGEQSGKKVNVYCTLPIRFRNS